MTQVLRLATYNVAWFNALFDVQGGFVNDTSDSALYGITKRQQFAAIGAVLRAINADGIMIIEAPDSNSHRSSAHALEVFAKNFGLRAHQAITGFQSGTEQEISFLFDPHVMTVRHDPMGAENTNAPAPRFDRQWDDVTGETTQPVRFSKPPLELEVKLITGDILRLIGVHIKSKAVHDAKTAASFDEISLQNRRKQLAESFWLRARIDQVLRQNYNLLVLGDLNDGPGLDHYERRFGHSTVEVIAGQFDQKNPPLFDPHSLPHAKTWLQNAPSSARFWDQARQSYFGAMLDYILASKDLVTGAKWRIWHPLEDPEIVKSPDLAQALLAASDHFPVSLDLSLPIQPRLG